MELALVGKDFTANELIGFAIILWKIWVHRNKVFYKGANPNPFKVVKEADEYIKQIKKAKAGWGNTKAKDRVREIIRVRSMTFNTYQMEEQGQHSKEEFGTEMEQH